MPPKGDSCSLLPASGAWAEARWVRPREKFVLQQAKFSTMCYFLKNSVAFEGKLVFYSKKFKFLIYFFKIEIQLTCSISFMCTTEWFNRWIYCDVCSLSFFSSPILVKNFWSLIININFPIVTRRQIKGRLHLPHPGVFPGCLFRSMPVTIAWVPSLICSTCCLVNLFGVIPLLGFGEVSCGLRNFKHVAKHLLYCHLTCKSWNKST